MRKYDSTHDGKAKEQQHQHLEQELRNSMVLFRAQRNFYITGFSLFLVLYVVFYILSDSSQFILAYMFISFMLLYLSSVIRRLMTLLAAQAALGASNEAAMKQAASASKTAKDLMDKKPAVEETNSKEHQEAMNKLKEELAEAKKGTAEYIIS